MATARDLVKSALRTIGVAQNRAPTSNESVDALEVLNTRVIEALATDDLWPFTVVEFEGNMVPGQQSYKLGTSPTTYTIDSTTYNAGPNTLEIILTEDHDFDIGDEARLQTGFDYYDDTTWAVIATPTSVSFTIGLPDTSFPSTAITGLAWEGNEGLPDFDTPRPNEIISFAYYLSNAYIPVIQVGVNDWSKSYRVDQTSTTPSRFRYKQDYPYGTLEVYPVPSSNYLVRVAYRQIIEAYAIDDEIQLPPGYYPFLLMDLASKLAIEYGIDSPRVDAEAMRLLANIKRQNTQSGKIDLGDVPLGDNRMFGGYNVYNDSMRDI